MPSISKHVPHASGASFFGSPWSGDDAGLAFPNEFSTLVVEQSSDCVTFSDEEGRLFYINPAGRRLLGLGADQDVTGTHFADYLAPTFASLCLSEVLPTAIRLGRWEGEMELVNRVTGEQVCVHRSVMAMRGPNGELKGFAAMSRDLRAQKAAERALIDSRERLEFALKAAKMIAWEWEPGTDRMKHTPHVEEAVPPIVSERRQFLEMLHPDDREHVLEEFNRCFADGSEYHIEYRVMTGSKPMWVQSVGRAVVEEDGRKRMRGILQDVTPRVESERALKESEERLAQQFAELEALYESAPVGLAVIDTDMRFVRINRLLAEINGIPAEAHIGRRVREVVPDLAPQAEESLQEILATGKPVYNLELTGETPAAPGVVRAWRENWVPLVNAEHRVIGISVAAIETTEQKRVADELARNQAQLRTIIETMPVGILFAEMPSGRIIDGNSHIERLMRHPVRMSRDIDAYGEWVSYHADGTLVDGHEYPLARMVLHGEEAPEIEVHYQRGDGTRAWMRIMGRAVKDAQGALVGGVVAVIDIDEQRRAEADLLALTAELEARVQERTRALRDANAQLAAEIERREAAQAALVQSQKLEALGQLTSGVAHDFNNIIAAISGGFRVIERRSTDPILIEVAQHGANAAERGAALVTQLLSFARKQELEPQTVDLHRQLEDCAMLIRQSAGPQVHVDIDVPAKLPHVRIDPVRLETTLLNLTVNARDAMNGEGRLSITARLSAGNEADRPCELNGVDAVLLTVTDTGCGMDEATLARATEPFFTTKAPGKGTGLGLAMVHGFVNQSGGALRIDSKAGEGTTFRIYLPKEVGPKRSLAKPRSPAEVRADHRARILLVDDDEAVRAVTAEILTDVGHQVTHASDGVTALQHLNNGHRFDVVMTDVAMPEMDGLTFAQEVRARHADLPILFVSGNVDHVQLEGEAVLNKPFTHDSLARKLDELIEKQASTPRQVGQRP